MSNQNKTDGEVGIIELLEYFKQGFKSIFKAIKNVFQKFFQAIVYFLLLIKRNLIFIAICIVIFLGLWYYIINSPSWKNYEYEMLVRPNFQSQNVLFTHIKSLSDINNSKEGGDFQQNIIKLEINPISNYTSQIDAYYETMNNGYDYDEIYKNSSSRDTIFFREVNIKDFIDKMEIDDYKFYKINLKTKKRFNSEKIYKEIIEPVEINPTFQAYKNSFIENIDYTIGVQKKTLSLIDTILITRTNKSTVSNASANFNLTDSKSQSVESELIKEKENVIHYIKSLNTLKSENLNVITVLSKAESIEPNRRLIRTPFFFSLYGFIFALMLLLIRDFFQYLNKLDKKDKEKSKA